MRASRAVLVVWTIVIVALVTLEIGELTRAFTIPIQRAVFDPIFLAVSLVFTTVIAVIGAIFVGVSITARLLSSQGFTPFEEEMLKMRAEITEIRHRLEEIAPAPPVAPASGHEEGR